MLYLWPDNHVSVFFAPQENQVLESHYPVILAYYNGLEHVLGEERGLGTQSYLDGLEVCLEYLEEVGVVGVGLGLRGGVEGTSVMDWAVGESGDCGSSVTKTVAGLGGEINFFP